MGLQSSRQKDTSLENILLTETSFKFQNIQDAQNAKREFLITNQNIINATKIKSITWNEIKKTARETPEGLQLLKAYGQFRTLFVNGLLQLAAQMEGCVSECRAYGVGTVSLVSDYDISMYGPMATHIVEQFNELFTEVWNGMASADVFDTNIYGSTYFFPLLFGNFTDFSPTKVDYSKIFTFVNVNDAQDQINQRIWATLKLYKFAHNLSIPDLTWYGVSIDTIYNNLYTYDDGTLVNIYDNHDLNDLYEERMRELPRLLQVFSESTPETRTTNGRNYKQQIALSCFYGNETYFTQGAFFHVVGTMQAKINPPTTVNELVDSLIENLGDFVKEAHHADTVYELVIKGSKYLTRIVDAIVRITVAKSKTNIINIDEMRSMAKLADSVKQQMRTKRIPDDLTQDDMMVLNTLREFFSASRSTDILSTCSQVLAFVEGQCRMLDVLLPFTVRGGVTDSLNVVPSLFASRPVKVKHVGDQKRHGITHKQRDTAESSKRRGTL